MHPYSFSTAPAAAGAGAFSTFHGDPSVMGAGIPALSTAAGIHGLGNSNSAGIPSTLFSTSAALPSQGMHMLGNPPPRQDNVVVRHYITSTVETNALDEAAFSRFNQAMTTLQQISAARPPIDWKSMINTVLSDISAGNTTASAAAAKLNEAFSKIPADTIGEAVCTLALQIKKPAYISLVAALDDPFKKDVRDLVLQELLDLLSVAGTQPMPVCAEMLVGMAQRELVRMCGVVAVIEQFLHEEGKRRAGMAVLGRAADVFRNDGNFARALQSNGAIEKMLGELYKDPEYEYDVLAVTRLLRCPGGGFQKESLPPYLEHVVKGTAVLQLARFMRVDAPVMSMHYFCARDELISAHADGTLRIWGVAPGGYVCNDNDDNNNNNNANSVGSMLPLPASMRRPSSGIKELVHTIFLPAGMLPVAMAGSKNCQFLAVSCIPCSPTHLYASSAEESWRREAARSAQPPPTQQDQVPTICSLEFSLMSGAWSPIKTIPRPRGVTLTAVAVLSDGTICCAESTAVASAAAAASSPQRLSEGHSQGLSGVRSNIGTAGGFSNGTAAVHSIALFHQDSRDVAHIIERAHEDFITVLETCDDKEQVLLSGSRDKAVKLWDTRVGSSNAAEAAAAAAAGGGCGLLYTLAASHTDTISCIYSYRYFIFTGSVDGSINIWDTRRMGSPILTRTFASPVLSMTALEGGCAAISTARGLYLVYLELMGAVDVIPNVGYTKVLCNEAGGVLFAARADGIAVIVPKPNSSQ